MPFDNFDFWKQFRGQMGSVGLTSQKGEAFLVLGLQISFLRLKNLRKQTVLTDAKYY